MVSAFDGGYSMAFCGKCGTAMVDGNSFCHSCGASSSTQPSSAVRTPGAAATAPALEKKFFEDQHVLVTNARCIIRGKTFAMSGITSVASYTEIRPRTGPIIMIIIGVLVVLGSLSSRDAIGGLFIGAVIIGLGVLWYKSIKNIYHVLIHSASGEARPLNDYNAQYINGIVQALNDAIVHRG
jgi:hypothetical protein